MHALKKNIYHLFQVSTLRYSASWWVDWFIICMIISNVAVLMLESVAVYQASFPAFFYWFDLFSVSIFTLEYFLRIWVSDITPRYRGKSFPRLRYMVSFLSVIDLIAILPFYVLSSGFIDLRSIRIFRLLTVFRIFKITRYVRALRLIERVLYQKREELFVSIIFTFFLLVLASTLMFYIEHEAQPDAFSSIPATLWWGVATLTTVGYGDIYPITPLGKLFGAVIALLGIGMVALPTGILASGFSEHLTEYKSKSGKCPTCGKPYKEQNSPLDDF